MLLKKSSFLLSALLLILPGLVLSDDILNSGPGLISGEEGAFTLYDSGKNKTSKNGTAEHKQTIKNQQASYAEFKRYQQWLDAKKNNSADYQEFLLWKDFLRQKQAD